MQNLDLSAIYEGIVTLSPSFALLTAAIAAWVGVRQYTLNAKAERRLRESNQAEVDVRLSKLFVELMWLAHARAGSHVSEKCIEELFEKGMITKEDLGNPCVLNTKIAACILSLPVGLASQNAAIVSVGVLGRRYEILREPAREGLNSLGSFKKEEVKRALALLDDTGK